MWSIWTVHAPAIRFLQLKINGITSIDKSLVVVDGTKHTPNSSMRVVLIEISEQHEKLVLVKLVRPLTHRTSDMYTQFYMVLEWILYLYSRVEVKDRSSLLQTIAKWRLRKIRPNDTTSWQLCQLLSSFPDSLTIGEVTNKITASCALYKHLSTKRYFIQTLFSENTSLFTWNHKSTNFTIGGLLANLHWSPLTLYLFFQDQALRSSVLETFNLLISKESSVGIVCGEEIVLQFSFP